jgi:hypothetical protein
MDNKKNKTSCCITTNNIDSPQHYTSGDIECIDAIKAALTKEEFRGYVKGNIVKYVWRERLKNGDEDLKKAFKYFEFLEVEK